MSHFHPNLCSQQISYFSHFCLSLLLANIHKGWKLYHIFHSSSHNICTVIFILQSLKGMKRNYVHFFSLTITLLFSLFLSPSKKKRLIINRERVLMATKNAQSSISSWKGLNIIWNDYNKNSFSLNLINSS